MSDISQVVAQRSYQIEGSKDGSKQLEKPKSGIVTFEDVLAKADLQELKQSDPTRMKALERIGFMGQTQIEEPTVSLREFITSLVKSIAEVFRLKGLNRAADFIVQERSLEMMTAHVANRIQNYDEQAQKQAEALKKMMGLMSGSESMTSNNEMLDSSQSSTQGTYEAANTQLQTRYGNGTILDFMKQIYDKATSLEGKFSEHIFESLREMISELQDKATENLTGEDKQQVLVKLGIAKSMYKAIEENKGSKSYFSDQDISQAQDLSDSMLETLSDYSAGNATAEDLGSEFDQFYQLLSTNDSYSNKNPFLSKFFKNIPDWQAGKNAYYQPGDIYKKNGELHVHLGNGESAVLDESQVGSGSMGKLREAMDKAKDALDKFKQMGTPGPNASMEEKKLWSKQRAMVEALLKDLRLQMLSPPSLKADVMSQLIGGDQSVATVLDSAINKHTLKLSTKVKEAIMKAKSSGDWSEVIKLLEEELKEAGSGGGGGFAEAKEILQEMLRKAKKNKEDTDAGEKITYPRAEMSNDLDTAVKTFTGVFEETRNHIRNIQTQIDDTFTADGVNQKGSRQGRVLRAIETIKKTYEEVKNLKPGEAADKLMINYVQTMYFAIGEMYSSQVPFTKVFADGSKMQYLEISRGDRESLFNMVRAMLQGVAIVDEKNPNSNGSSMLMLVEKYTGLNDESKRDAALAALREKSSIVGEGNIDGKMKQLEDQIDKLREAAKSKIDTETNQNVKACVWSVEIEKMDAGALNSLKSTYDQVKGPIMNLLHEIDNDIYSQNAMEEGTKVGNAEANFEYKLDGFETAADGKTRDHTYEVADQSLRDVKFKSSAMAAAGTIVGVLQDFDLFFNSTASSVAIHSSVIDKQGIMQGGALWGGTMMEYATWGKITNVSSTWSWLAGRKDTYVQWSSDRRPSDYYAHFTSNADRDIPGTRRGQDQHQGTLTNLGFGKYFRAEIANPLAEHCNIMYDKSKDFLNHTLLPAARNLAADHNDLLLSVEQEVRFNISQSFATSSVLEEMFMKIFEDVDLPDAEKQLVSKALAMLLSLLIGLMSGNDQVKGVIQKAAQGQMDFSAISDNMRIGESVAAQITEKAINMVSQIIDKKKRGEMMASDTLSMQYYADLGSFYSGNRAMFAELESQEDQQRVNESKM